MVFRATVAGRRNFGARLPVDARVPEFSVRNDNGDFAPLPMSAADLAPGGYTLALRLRHEHQPNQWRDAAVIPVLRIRISSGGDVTFRPMADLVDRPEL